MDNTHALTKFRNDPERLATLQADVIACLPAFPVLRAQLKQTVAQAEQAVVEVCESFHSMVDRARESVNQATASLSGSVAGVEEESGAQALISLTHRMLERTDAASEMTLSTVQTMEDVEERMRNISGSLQDVDAIARTLRLLSLNATIEAARAGEHGRTFGVVADETTKLAGAAAQISRSIQKTVEQLRKSVDDTSQRLRTVSTTLSVDSKTNRLEVEEAVGVMAATEENLRQSIEQSARSSESLADDIARAVIAMQFQDSMSQQVTHVVDALEEVEAGLSNCVSVDAAMIADNGQRIQHDLTRSLMSRYTMQSERDIHAAQLGSQSCSTDFHDDNIELF